jgi:imidazolonepropionase-like amidohydrolase
VHLMLVGHADYAHWDRAYAQRLRDEIMPAAARQLLHAGVTSARDLGAPLDDSIAVRNAQRNGALEGPTLYVSGPFIQKAPYPGTEAFRWGVDGADDARRKVQRLCAAGIDVVKLIDQDEMTRAEAQAVVDAAHACGKPVIAHAHRPEEIRIGLAIGVDGFEHTGLSSAPEYPADVVAALAERTASMAKGPLWWTPTIEGLWNYEYVRDHREGLDDPAWQLGLRADTVADIRASIAHPERLPYFQLTPLRKPTLATKFAQLRRAGVVLLVGTDSGIPMKFHSRSTWNEIDIWTRELDVPAMQAIRAATYWPAVAMKVDRDYGTLTPGKWADVIAVRGDVLRYPALLQNVPFVMKHGRIVKDERPAATRQ